MAAPILTTPFTGRWRGLWRRTRTADMDPLYASTCRNVVLRGNTLGLRGGTKRLTGAVGPGLVRALHWARFRDGTDQVIGDRSGTLERYVPSGVVDPEWTVQALPLAGVASRAGGIPTITAALDNHVFIVNGSDPDVKYTGQVVQRLGIEPPSVPPHVGLALEADGVTPLSGTNVLVGSYGWRYTYVNSVTQQESEPSPETRATVSATPTDLLGIAVAQPSDPQVDRIRLYRTLTDAEGVWYFVTEAIYTYPGTIPDQVPDSALGTLLEEFVNLPPPGPLALVATWPQAGRLCGVPAADRSALYYTDILPGDLRPESWPPANVVFVNYDDGDEIVAVVPLFDSVIIQKRRSTWRLQGVPPELTLEPVHFDQGRTGLGGLGQQATCAVGTDQFLPSRDGAYAMSRWAAGGSGFESNRLSRDIDELWATMVPTQAARVHAVYCRDQQQVRLWACAGADQEPSTCWVYQADGTADGEATGWSEWTVPATASVVVETAQGDRVLLAGPDGHLYRMDDGYTDGWTASGPGTAIDWHYVTVPFAPAGDVLVDARGRFLDVTLFTLDPVLLTVETAADFGVPVPTYRSVFPLGGIDPTRPDVAVPLDPIPQLVRMIVQPRGRYHTLGLRMAVPAGIDGPAAFRVESMFYRWQALPMKARAAAPKVAA